MKIVRSLTEPPVEVGGIVVDEGVEAVGVPSEVGEGAAGSAGGGGPGGGGTVPPSLFVTEVLLS